MGNVGDFFSSYGAYWNLLRHMSISSDMFTCSNSWHHTFQAWNVVYTVGTLLVTLAFVVIYLVKYFQDQAYGSVEDFLIASFIAMLVPFLVAHLGWFCVVVNDGCCGCIGYALWGVVYLVVFLSRYSPRFLEKQHLHHSSEFVRIVNKYFFYGQQHSDWANIVYAVLLVPIVYMSLSCFALACGGATRSRGVFGFLE
ncbi:unnamed protein product [Polarella glacialis]|uniref:Uncharacterized protein n=1 Tax=Polarella glacialis TaxID=89957 RepID=A0A813EJ70_POLGL|nr:unnamed protein product [Polarella glacialis]CAE8645822.1 unnamed protein product [Polarella glacialis]